MDGPLDTTPLMWDKRTNLVRIPIRANSSEIESHLHSTHD